jgi:hypothetical protein
MKNGISLRLSTPQAEVHISQLFLNLMNLKWLDKHGR